MIFARESFDKSYRDAMPLVVEHYREIAHYQDIELAPDLERYLRLDELGMLQTYTARDPLTNDITGYQVFIMAKGLHYSKSMQALEDVLFITGRRRGFGVRFIKYADDELRKLGVQTIYRHVKLAHNHGKILLRDGYEAVDTIYAKRLDAPR